MKKVQIFYSKKISRLFREDFAVFNFNQASAAAPTDSQREGQYIYYTSPQSFIITFSNLLA